MCVHKTGGAAEPLPRKHSLEDFPSFSTLRRQLRKAMPKSFLIKPNHLSSNLETEGGFEHKDKTGKSGK